ncbi:MAG TPA: hypothetical protein VHZ95_11860 [Polyangiales bacterium]|jgi:predicted transcriptional regulator|nr:hypothetical protein [Polyangiales bacterium]
MLAGLVGTHVDRSGELMTTTTAAATPSAKLDLETRVANRKQELIDEIVEYKKGSRLDAAEAVDRLKARLSELSHIVKEGVVDGWANVGQRARQRLDEWLAQ